jgi:predicted acetyltransferase
MLSFLIEMIKWKWIGNIRIISLTLWLHVQFHQNLILLRCKWWPVVLVEKTYCHVNKETIVLLISTMYFTSRFQNHGLKRKYMKIIIKPLSTVWQITCPYEKNKSETNSWNASFERHTAKAKIVVKEKMQYVATK